MDVGTVVASVLGSSAISGVLAATISGWLNHRARVHLEKREDQATRRLVRGQARDLAAQVLYLRKFGFANVDTMLSARSALRDALADHDVLKALSDAEASSLEKAIRHAGPLLYLVTDAYGEPGKVHGARNLAQTQDDLREASLPTFSALRDFFQIDNTSDTLSEFDEAEKQYEALMRRRFGMPQ